MLLFEMFMCQTCKHHWCSVGCSSGTLLLVSLSLFIKKKKLKKIKVKYSRKTSDIGKFQGPLPLAFVGGNFYSKCMVAIVQLFKNVASLIFQVESMHVEICFLLIKQHTHTNFSNIYREKKKKKFTFAQFGKKFLQY